MKLFNTNNMSIVNSCQLNFAFELPSVLVPMRLIKFESALWTVMTFLLCHHYNNVI